MRRRRVAALARSLFVLAAAMPLACAGPDSQTEEIMLLPRGAAGSAGAPPRFERDPVCAGTPTTPNVSWWPAPIEVLAEVDPPSWMPVGVAVDDAHVYFAVTRSIIDGEIRRVDKSGGAVTVVATAQKGPVAILVDATHVYWDSDGIKKLSKAEGAMPESLLVGTPVLHMAQDIEWIFWSDLAHDAVGKVSKQGGPAIVLAMPAGGPQQVTAHGDWLYWAAYVTGAIMRVPKSGGPAEVVASGQTRVRGVAADCHGIHWFGPQGPMWLPAVGEGMQYLGQTDIDYNGHLSLDARYIYSAGGTDGIVVRAPRAGVFDGSLKTIPDTTTLGPNKYVWNVAVDDTHVYWANNETARIQRLPK